MSILYLHHNGDKLRYRTNRFIIERDEKCAFSIPFSEVYSVVVVGNVEVTTPALHHIFKLGIDMTYLSVHGNFYGKIYESHSKNVPLKIAQYRKADDKNFCLKMACAFANGKIHNQYTVLKRFFRNHNQKMDESDAGRLKSAIKRLNSVNSIEQLRGIEGSCSVLYFKLLNSILPEEFKFKNRNRRPPLDRFNSLINFTYSLLEHELFSALNVAGLDPYIGYLHSPEYGRPSLVFDIMEEFRPSFADAFSLMLVNKNIIKPDDFHKEGNGGIYLNDDARALFFKQYEKRMKMVRSEDKENDFVHLESEDNELTFRKLFILQAEKIAKAILGKAEYNPYQFRS